MSIQTKLFGDSPLHQHCMTPSAVVWCWKTGVCMKSVSMYLPPPGWKINDHERETTLECKKIDFLFSADIVVVVVVVFCPVVRSLDYIFRLVLQYLILNIGGRGACIKPHDDITTVDVFPSLRPAASQMLRNEHRSAAMQSCKCHMLFMTLLHKEVNFACEANNKYCSFFF